MFVSWYALRARTTDRGRRRTEDVSEMMLYYRFVSACEKNVAQLKLTAIGPMVKE